MRKVLILLIPFIFLVTTGSRSFDPSSLDAMKVVTIDVADREGRTQIASMGIAIEEVYDDYIVGLAQDAQIAKLAQSSFKFTVREMPAFLLDFSPEDSDFHNVKELEEALVNIAQTYPEIASLHPIGRSIENRPLYMMRISGPDNAEGSVPGIIFTGTHHAREHLSTEVPLYLIKHFVENYGKNDTVTNLVNSREIWIMPLVNPDGAHHDIQDPRYKWWRKNRWVDEESGRVYGVDLNRNYSYKWGGEGSGSEKGSQTYRGAAPFSEPETRAIRDFVTGRDNITILLSYHTFSELILYPWGHTYDSIGNANDLKVHEIMAQEMGRMTGYRPQQASDLYLVSGDTMDWAYGELGLIAFTFELFPTSIMDGGFYPAASNIQSVVQNNIAPAEYLVEYADNPHRVLEGLNHNSLYTPNHLWHLN